MKPCQTKREELYLTARDLKNQEGYNLGLTVLNRQEQKCGKR